MIKLFSSLIDRFLFTLSFIVGVQLPEFMQQYIQRLSGHLNEAKYQLQQFQAIADLQFNGDFNLMLERYLQNTDQAIVQTGEVIGAIAERVQFLDSQLMQLQQGDYPARLYAFASQLNIDMAKATMSNFSLAVPLELSALSIGAIVALLVLFVQQLILFVFRKLLVKPVKAF